MRNEGLEKLGGVGRNMKSEGAGGPSSECSPYQPSFQIASGPSRKGNWAQGAGKCQRRAGFNLLDLGDQLLMNLLSGSYPLPTDKENLGGRET